MPAPKNRVVICFRLNKGLHDELKSYVYENELMFQHVLAEAVKEYLESKKK